MRGRDQLHAALRDRASCRGLRLGPDLVDDHDLGHVVLHRLDHDGVLALRARDLHATGAPDPGVRDVAVAADLVGGVHDDDPPPDLVGQHTGRFAEQGRLADPGRPEQEHAMARLDHVAQDFRGTTHGAPDAAGESDHVARPVADRRDAVESPLDAGTVVARERTERGRDVEEILAGHRGFAESNGAVGEAGLGGPPQIENHFEQRGEVGAPFQRLAQTFGQHAQEEVGPVGVLRRGLHRPGRVVDSVCQGPPRYGSD